MIRQERGNTYSDNVRRRHGFFHAIYRVNLCVFRKGGIRTNGKEKNCKSKTEQKIMELIKREIFSLPRYFFYLELAYIYIYIRLFKITLETWNLTRLQS